jgi:predicted DNA-binding ribbon-helix-helix protein
MLYITGKNAFIHAANEQRERKTAMCTLYANQDPKFYAPVTRSVRIGGVATSLRLEAGFWLMLDELSASQGYPSTSRFINTLYDEVLEIHGEVANFASLLRVSCLLYAEGRSPFSLGPAATQQVRKVA